MGYFAINYCVKLFDYSKFDCSIESFGLFIGNIFLLRLKSVIIRETGFEFENHKHDKLKIRNIVTKSDVFIPENITIDFEIEICYRF